MQIITIQNVRAYLDTENTIWLNAEDVARGLGFTETAASGNVTIRWRTVRSYLDSFGYQPIAGSCDEINTGDYIPENMFYRLAMKAKNAVAEKFQALVADEILPTLRKTGSYNIKPKVPTPVGNVIQDIKATTVTIQELFEVKKGIALSQAIDLVSAYNDFNLEPLKQLLPPAEHETGFLNPTQIGQHLGGLPPQAVNKLLAESNLQYRQDKQWRLTPEGTEYGEEMPFTRNGHSGYQIRWNESIVDCLKTIS